MIKNKLVSHSLSHFLTGRRLQHLYMLLTVIVGIPFIAAPVYFPPNGGDGTPVLLSTSSLVESLPNDTGTGTTTNRLVVYTSAAKAKVATTSDTSNVIGVCVSGCTTSGTSHVAISGQASCEFDGTTTAGHFVIASTSTGGKCSDGGTSVPASVQVIGYALAGGAGAGTRSVDFSNMGTMAALNSKAQPGGNNGEFQYRSSGNFAGAANLTISGSNLVVVGPVLGSSNRQSGTTYTAASTDCGLTVVTTSASAVAVTLPNSLSIDCHVVFLQEGAGQITFSAGSGATLRGAHSYTKTFGQYSKVELYVGENSGGAAAVYYLNGDGA